MAKTPSAATDHGVSLDCVNEQGGLIDNSWESGSNAL